MKSVREKMYYELAREYVSRNNTVRSLAKDLNMPKTTVHNWLQKFITLSELFAEDYELANEVHRLLEKNKQERSYRGGNATKVKKSQEKLKNKN